MKHFRLWWWGQSLLIEFWQICFIMCWTHCDWLNNQISASLSWAHSIWKGFVPGYILSRKLSLNSGLLVATNLAASFISDSELLYFSKHLAYTISLNTSLIPFFQKSTVAATVLSSWILARWIGPSAMEAPPLRAPGKKYRILGWCKLF